MFYEDWKFLCPLVHALQNEALSSRVCTLETVIASPDSPRSFCLYLFSRSSLSTPSLVWRIAVSEHCVTQPEILALPTSCKVTL